MQRQSLGSPVSKLHSHGGGAKEEIQVVEEEPKRNKHLLASASNTDYYDEDGLKASKPHRFSLSSSPPPRPEKFIHLIPILTILCFLILYICSHSPSQSDLAQFHGLKRSSNEIDTEEFGGDLDGGGRLIDVKRDNVLAIRSLRNLQEIGKDSPKSRFHRKIADF